MEYVDLVDRLIPTPVHTIVFETPKGDLVLIDTKRTPTQGDTVLVNDALRPYEVGLAALGVAYCSIHFL